MARVSILSRSGDQGLQGGSLPKVIQQTAECWKPEEMYPTTFDGKRTAFDVFDLPESSRFRSLPSHSS
jgi:hypothetical protein